MTYFMVDVEADGPIPGPYSMTELGAAAVKNGKIITFYGALAPISENYVKAALDSIGKTRAQTLEEGKNPKDIMMDFDEWINKNTDGRPMFISDNNGFDWMFVCWYFWNFLGKNPFGHSSSNLGSLYKGVMKDTFANFKRLRKTKHTHHPVDDAVGNLEALIEIKKRFDLRIRL